MTTFKLKKIITGISLLTMIFSLGSNVNAMNNDDSIPFPKGSPYYVLDNDTKLNILITREAFYFDKNKSQNFRRILDGLYESLLNYDDPSKQSLVSRTIGIAKLKTGDGFAINKNFLSKFIGLSKSNLSNVLKNLHFIEQKYDKKSDKEKILLQALEFLMPSELSEWFIYIQQKPKVNPTQNTQALPLFIDNDLVIPFVNSYFNQNNLSIPIDSTQQNTPSLPQFNNPQSFGGSNSAFFNNIAFQEDDNEDNDDGLKILQHLLERVRNNE